MWGCKRACLSCSIHCWPNMALQHHFSISLLSGPLKNCWCSTLLSPNKLEIKFPWPVVSPLGFRRMPSPPSLGLCFWTLSSCSINFPSHFLQEPFQQQSQSFFPWAARGPQIIKVLPHSEERDKIYTAFFPDLVLIDCPAYSIKFLVPGPYRNCSPGFLKALTVPLGPSPLSQSLALPSLDLHPL